MKIVVLAGGLSPERNVSLSSGTMVCQALRDRGHQAAFVDMFFGTERYGGAAAGLGSALYDLLAGGYDPGQALITFVSKFAMAWVCAKVAGREKGKGTLGRDYVACLLGALTYIALYMLKTFIYKSFVTPVPADTLGAVMVSRLIPSLINGGVAVAVTPLLYQTMVPALKKSGVLNRE